MSFQQNCEGLRACNLPGFLDSYVDSHSDPACQKLSHDDRLAMYINAQLSLMERRKYDRLLRAAKLKYPHACPEDIDYVAERGLLASVIADIHTLAWVEKCQNVIFIGKTGTGKTYMANSTCNLCIRKGYSVLHYRVSELLELAEIARADGSLPRLRKKVAKARVLSLDDLGISPITPQGRHDLLEFIEARSTTGSLVITSQVPVEKWHEWLGEPTIADAILDRVVHRAHIIQLKGESMRKLKESV